MPVSKRKEMAVETSIQPIQNFEITPETLEFTTGADTRNIEIKHFLCLRQTLPKTRLSQTILYENVSYDRQLRMKMKSMQKDRLRNAQVLESNMRAFQHIQKKKQQKWKRLDEVRLSNMNLPCVNLASENDRPKSCRIMYRMSEFKPEGEKTDHLAPVLPKMNLTVIREQTEIITHREKTFMTRFPEIIEIDPKLLDRHNNYCGKRLLEEGGSGRDIRFNMFMNSLSPVIVKEDDYPIENLKSMSRLHKYTVKTGRSATRSARQKPKSHHQNIKDEVAKRFNAIKSRENTFCLGETNNTANRYQKMGSLIKQTNRFQKRGEYILETYKSEDIIYLSGKQKKKEHEDIPEASETSDVK